MNHNELFRQFCLALGKFYNVDPADLIAGKYFTLQVPQAAELGTNIQQKSDFLQKINMFQVTDVKGHKLLGATEKGITGRKQDGRYLATLNHDQKGYELFETDSGVIVPWQMFTNFARFGNKLFELYADYVQTQIALDRLQIGWHGKSVAENTAATDMSDVNKGWLTLLKEQKSANVYTGTNGKITLFGDNAEFSNLDSLAFDLKQGLALRHQNRNDLVFLVGADLVSAETKLINKQAGMTPTERAALGTHNLMGSFAGMPAMTPPNFPAKGAVVTSLSNLSIYTQSNTQKRRYEDNQDRKGLIDSYWRMEGYVVEDLDLMTAIDASKVEIIDQSQANE
ncbi:capsid protein [[Actinobacillus] muris]|uniref:Capsid protein n=1 Tax=Muribacter muris TaxID=67855 RepID=A0A0J5P6T8_9PAST|nr:phage major capsid protein, P2 family [Muribacter muris]KMK51480.1 capsid protein [[Actinobacillus] muris] [Muribacter muris]